MNKIYFLSLLMLSAACSREPPSMPENSITAEMRTTYPDVAAEFAEALVNGKYEVAYAMLGSTLEQEYTPDELGNEYEAMVEYGDSNVKSDGVLDTMEDWPTRKPMDVGWAYVSITGDEFAEAITVIVSVENDVLKISNIEWGRP
jgi:hypothetical protein